MSAYDKWAGEHMDEPVEANTLPRPSEDELPPIAVDNTPLDFDTWEEVIG